MRPVYRKVYEEEKKEAQRETVRELFNKEFDPGSGRTLAARLKHASRTENIFGTFRREGYNFSGGRVSNM